MAESFFIRSLSNVHLSNELFTKRASRSLAGTVSLANTGEPFLQLITATAALTLNLPLETINDGKLLLIYNAGTGTITVQSNAGAALPVPVSVATQTGVLMACDGTVWRQVLT